MKVGDVVTGQGRFSSGLLGIVRRADRTGVYAEFGEARSWQANECADLPVVVPLTPWQRTIVDAAIANEALRRINGVDR